MTKIQWTAANGDRSELTIVPRPTVPAEATFDLALTAPGGQRHPVCCDISVDALRQVRSAIDDVLTVLEAAPARVRSAIAPQVLAAGRTLATALYTDSLPELADIIIEATPTLDHSDQALVVDVLRGEP